MGPRGAVVQQVEAEFQRKLIINPGWPGYGRLHETQARYESFLGRQLSRTEILALDGESDALPTYALLGFILKAHGINLVDYDINARLYSAAGGRMRALSLHSNFLEELDKYLGVTPKQGY